MLTFSETGNNPFEYQLSYTMCTDVVPGPCGPTVLFLVHTLVNVV